MAKLRISGDNSGYVDLTVPVDAGSVTKDVKEMPQLDENNTFVGTQTFDKDWGSNVGSIKLVGDKPSMNFNSDSYGNWIMHATYESAGSRNDHLSVYRDTTGSGAWDRVHTINESGYILTPKQPSFSAVNGTEHGTTTTIATISFTTALVNIGSHYSTSNYRFTAPISGVYRFTFSLMCWSNQHSRCQFAKNGTLVGNQFYASANSNYSRNCGEIFLSLAANDYVEVKRNVQSESNEGMHSNYRHFAGQLIA